MTEGPHPVRVALLTTALAVALASCGAASPGTAGSTDVPSARGSVSSDASPARGPREQITPGGIAVVVLDHLGARAVKQVGTYEPEPGSVGLMIRLRAGTRADNFAVTVSSPEQAGELGPAGTCPPEVRKGRPGRGHCRTLARGTTVMTDESAEGFSDDNADGMVVYGTAVTPGAGAAMALYESYDDTPAVRAADLEDLLTDPRLTWLTDPALNEAGEDVDVVELDG